MSKLFYILYYRYYLLLKNYDCTTVYTVYLPTLYLVTVILIKTKKIIKPLDPYKFYSESEISYLKNEHKTWQI